MAAQSPVAACEVSSLGGFRSLERPDTLLAGDRERRLIELQKWGMQGLDLAAVAAAVVAAGRVSSTPEPGGLPFVSSRALLAGVGVGTIFILLLGRHGAYRPCRSLLGVRDTERILRVTVQTFLLAEVAAYCLAIPISLTTAALAFVAVPLSVMLEKWHAHKVIRFWRMKGHGMRRTVVLGGGRLGWETYSTLVRSPEYGLEPVAVVDEDPNRCGQVLYDSSYDCRRTVTVEPGPVDLELLRRKGASAVVVAVPGLQGRDQQALVSQFSASGAALYFVAENFAEPGYWIDHTEIDGLVLARISSGQSRFTYDLLKRLLDLCLGTLALALALPLLAVAALAVAWTSPGPVFFWQERIGSDGRRFRICKLRTMYCDAPAYADSPAASADPRLTPVGRFLRRCSLDELPQLFNVLRGDMSLVGPRPEMAYKVANYTPLQRLRLSMRPGMTGLWQISGDRVREIHLNMEYDLYYLRHRNVFMDVAILLHTGVRMASGI